MTTTPPALSMPAAVEILVEEIGVIMLNLVCVILAIYYSLLAF
jgi:hypothetical protein